MILYYSSFDRNTGRLVTKYLKLNLKKNKEDILIIDNMETIKSLNDLNLD